MTDTDEIEQQAPEPTLDQKLDALLREIRELKAMVCPVCGPPIHAQNHPEQMEVVARNPGAALRHSIRNGHRG